jgi:methyl-accepting chemotaxis protein
MDFTDALRVHAEWKLRFRRALSGEERPDAAEVSDDSACELGRWIHGRGGERHGALEEFLALRDRHREFHAEAAIVARLIEAGKLDQAEQAIGAVSRYATASAALRTAVAALRGLLQDQ